MPHSMQNRAPGSEAAPQLAQGIPSGTPHDEQYLATGGLEALHRGHVRLCIEWPYLSAALRLTLAYIILPPPGAM